MSTPHKHVTPQQVQQADLPQQTTLPTQPLTEADARRAEAEALHRTLETREEVIEARRRGRIEVETWRVSEEVTRQAQERLRVERLRLEQNAVPAGAENEMHEAMVPAPGRTLPEPMTIGRLLVGLDGTPYSERALPYALAIASWAHAAIVLAHVREPEPGGVRAAFSKVVDSSTDESSARHVPDVATYLDTLRERVEMAARRVEMAAHRVETVTLRAGTAADGLAEAIEQTHADVVVLATHTRQGLERRILGSVGDQLIQRTRVPVLMIPRSLDLHPEQTPSFRRVLVPLDGSLLAEQALAPVLALARCVSPNDLVGMDIVLYSIAESQDTLPHGARYVQDLRERLLQMHLPDSVRVRATAVVGSAPGAITSAAIHGVLTEPGYPQRFDVVAMATHGRGGFQRWVYGSVAEHVLSHVAVPTLLVHPERTDM